MVWQRNTAKVKGQGAARHLALAPAVAVAHATGQHGLANAAATKRTPSAGATAAVCSGLAMHAKPAPSGPRKHTANGRGRMPVYTCKVAGVRYTVKRIGAYVPATGKGSHNLRNVGPHSAGTWLLTASHGGQAIARSVHATQALAFTAAQALAGAPVPLPFAKGKQRGRRGGGNG